MRDNYVANPLSSKGLHSNITAYVAASDSIARDKATADFVCDGAADNVEIQAALDSITSIGGTVQLAAGNYLLSDTVLVPSNTTFRCTSRGSAKIKVDALVDEPVIANADWDGSGGGDTNIMIENLYIDGNRANQTAGAIGTIKDSFGNGGALYLANITELRVINNDVLNSPWAGIETTVVTNVYIYGNKVDNSNDDGIGINNNSLHVTVVNNIVTDAGKDNNYGAPAALEIQDGAAFVTVKGNYLHAATTDNVGENKAGGVQISSHTGGGECHDLTIMGNTIEGGRAYMITVNSDDADGDPYSIVIDSNVIFAENDMGNGIKIARIKDSILSNNILKRVHASDGLICISIDAATDFIIKGNVIYGGSANGGDVGIAFGRSSGTFVLNNILVEGNIFSDHDWGPFRFEDSTIITCDRLIIRNNYFGSSTVVATYAAVWTDDAGVTFTNCIWENNTWEATNEFFLGGSSTFGGVGWTVVDTSYGRRIKRASVTSSPYTVLATDHHISVTTTSTAITLNLPAIVFDGDVYHIKDQDGNASGNNITVSPNGSDTIENAASLGISNNGASVTLVSNLATTNWEIQ